MNLENYQHLISIGWALAEEGGLHRLTPLALSQKSGFSLLEVEEIAPNQRSLLLLLIADILSQVTPFKTENLSEIDTLFDIIMTGFDAAQSRRKAIQKIWYDLSSHPLLLSQILSPFQNKINEIIVTTFPEKGRLSILVDKVGLQLVSGKVFLTWVRDETLDLSKTMADLDHSLKQYSQVKNYIGPVAG